MPISPTTWGIPPAPLRLQLARSCHLLVRLLLLLLLLLLTSPPLLVLPLLVPLVICAVEASRLVMDGGTVASAGVWIRVLATFDVIFAVAGWMLFEQLVEE